jgi:hypothetical protein
VESVRIGIRLAPPVDVAQWLAEGAAFDAAGADALWVEPGELDPFVLVGALAAMTYRARLVLDPYQPAELIGRTLAAVSRDRVGPPDAWEAAPVPIGRTQWREALADAAQRGVPGLVVPADARLLDLLRNPDGEIDRRDLQLSSG